MSHVCERFRTVLARSTCTLAANIFAPLAARIAYLLGYDVCGPSGSVGNVAYLAAGHGRAGVGDRGDPSAERHHRCDCD